MEEEKSGGGERECSPTSTSISAFEVEGGGGDEESSGIYELKWKKQKRLKDLPEERLKDSHESDDSLGSGIVVRYVQIDKKLQPKFCTAAAAPVYATEVQHEACGSKVGESEVDGLGRPGESESRVQIRGTIVHMLEKNSSKNEDEEEEDDDGDGELIPEFDLERATASSRTNYARW